MPAWIVLLPHPWSCQERNAARRGIGVTNARRSSSLLAQGLDVAPPVWMEELLPPFLPSGDELGPGDVPVRPALPRDGPQVLAQLFHRGPAQVPVAIVDPVDDEAGLQ